MSENSETSEKDLKSPIRDELVDTAVKFLQNPKVVNSPLGQKQSFLQRRGLTEEEIRLACEKSGAYDKHEEQQKEQPPSLSPPPQLPGRTYAPVLTHYPGYPPLQLSLFHKIREIVHSIAIFSIVAYVVRHVYVTYIAPFLFGTKRKSIADKLDDLEKNVGDVQNSLGEVKEEINRINGLGEENELVSELKELKSEIASVKGLLLTRKQFPSISNSVVPPSIPAWQMQNEPEKEELLEIGSGSGSGSSEQEHGMKTSESSLEIIYSAKDYDSESCHSGGGKKNSRDETVND